MLCALRTTTSAETSSLTASTDADFGPKFRARFGKEDGQALPIQVERAGQRLTLNGKVRLVSRVESRLEIDPAAPPRAVRVREGILKGTTGP